MSSDKLINPQNKYWLKITAMNLIFTGYFVIIDKRYDMIVSTLKKITHL